MTEEWTLARIQQMIADGIEEGRTLDYKSADALKKTDGKKNEISKDVSAFANAGGGTIIYGIKEFDQPTKRHLPEKLDPINRDDISKEWLEQIINTKIQPRIEGVEIDPIEVSNEDNTVIYVVNIPQSNTAHQAAGHKYYKRYNFESIPMEDYEIRDVMNRSIFPDLTLGFAIEKLENNSRIADVSFSTSRTFLKVRVFNKGRVYAKYINYTLLINRFLLKESKFKSFETRLKKDSGEEYIEYYAENTVQDDLGFENNSRKFGPSRFDPVLPGMYSRSEKLELIEGQLNSFKDEKISWTIFADNAPPKKGEVRIGEVEKFKEYYL